MWDKVMYRLFQGCIMTLLIGTTSICGIRIAKIIKEEVSSHGRDSK